MTTNLALTLEEDTTYEKWGSYNDGSTFDFDTGESCGTSNGTCIMNGNTVTGFYSWYAATAGKGTSSTTSDVNGSICPAGWKLPYNYDNYQDKSYGGLTLKYFNFATSNSTSTPYTGLVNLPLSFIRSYAYNNGVKNEINWSGAGTVLYWSSTANNAANAYSIISYYSEYYKGYSNNAQDGRAKYFGFMVRCVAI